MPQQKPPEAYRKQCTLCSKPRDVLVRCQIDPSSIAPPTTEGQRSDNDGDDNDKNSEDENDGASPKVPINPNLDPKTWHFVCPGTCWRRVSGGVIDGDLEKGREGYRYGGMWKNKHAGVSAKVPKRLKGKMVRGAGEGGGDADGGDREGERDGVGEGGGV